MITLVNIISEEENFEAWRALEAFVKYESEIISSLAVQEVLGAFYPRDEETNLVVAMVNWILFDLYLESEDDSYFIDTDIDSEDGTGEEFLQIAQDILGRHGREVATVVATFIINRNYSLLTPEY